MNVLIACEFSGIVRDAFIAVGCSAISCDLLPSERPGPHHTGDVKELIESQPNNYFDLMICHPPCTHLAVSGSRWFKDKQQEQELALEFVGYLLSVPIDYICLENPISIISSRIRKPDQIIQPWMFGHAETKATCLWLKNLYPLAPTNVIHCEPTPRVHWESPGPDRWKNRSRTLQGIADAMANQWGCDL